MMSYLAGMQGLGKSKEAAMTEDLPRTVENPIAGERITFLATAEETNGEYVRVRNEASAGAQGPVMHYHLAYTEAFKVLKGRLDMCVGKENHLVLGEGESAFVPLSTAHRFWNSSTEPVLFEVEVRPARNFEKAIRAQVGLVEDGKTNEKAIPKNLFELALIYELSESYIVGMPLFLQKGIFGTLAEIVRLLGYDPEFSEYTKPESAPVKGRAPAFPVKGLARLAALTAALALLLSLWRRGRRNRRR